ncbi:nitrate- and nitrite sensing domain-containing protein [Streptomyces synnematoformans]|uniref:histidine kinase n=1 Tax=Streptomyces synnematoformans TaxID=415721 RepID=A0ABN2A7N8_9ACTN
MRRSSKGPAQETRGNFSPPSHAAAPPPAGAQPAPPPPSGSRFSPRNWRVATRLNAILLIPVLVALVFAGLRVNSSVETWREAQDAENTAKVAKAAADYADRLMAERDVSVQPLLHGDREASRVTEARQATDAAAAEFDRQVEDMPDTSGLTRRLKAVREQEKNLEQMRQAAFTSQAPGADTHLGYAQMYRPLMTFANELGLGTSNITTYGRAMYAISLSKSAASLVRSIGTELLVSPPEKAEVLAEEKTALASFAYLEPIALDEFRTGSTEADNRMLKDALADQEDEAKQRLAEAQREAESGGGEFTAPPEPSAMLAGIAGIGEGATPESLAEQGITPQTWYAATSVPIAAYRTVEIEFADRAVADAHDIVESAKRDTVVGAAIAVGALLIGFVIAAMMARSMGRSMRLLRNSAFGVAEQRLPMLVDQLSRTDPGRVDTRVQPIPLHSRDEIGEVARAFDQVHREAVRLAAEQALLRGNLNAIFTNLSRRNQGLIERQLELISGLEDHEADPEQLENLFHMDHLATRMRRNGENLLVLAGEDTGRHMDEEVPLVDVLRAATSEVESYERIELEGVPDSEIHGSAVTDLVHLLAELLENATTFSSPHTKVRVTATRLPDRRVMVEIHDKGIGLTAEDFADINHRLANPPTVDVAISQRMGLFVVGRLADRHGIRVQLRPSGEQSGTTSLVMLPEAIAFGGSTEASEQQDEFTVSRIVADRPSFQPAGNGFAGGRARSAAELGFDDSSYPQVEPRSPMPALGGQEGVFDPIQRSLLREERRAALEAAAQDRTPGFHDSEAEDVGTDPFAPGGISPEPAYDTYGHVEPDVPPNAWTGQGAYDSLAHPEAESPVVPAAGHPGFGFGEPEPAPVDDEWRSANDERWERAEQVREPKAGGVTSAGLPRRVPRQNLVEGTAEQPQLGGPQVSRAPEDVRGRLSNLRRGVQQGRQQGPQQSDGPGTGPGTYDQER